MTTKGDLTRNNLIQKGIELFWSKGYNATSINDIVKEANVKKGSFYFYFESKEDFAVAVIKSYFEMFSTDMFKILSDETVSPKERLIKFYRYRIDFLENEMKCTKGCVACNIGNEMAEHSEKIRKTLLEKESTFLNAISEVVKEAQANGEIDNGFDPYGLVSFIEDAQKGAMISMKKQKSSYPLKNFLRTVEKIL